MVYTSDKILGSKREENWVFEDRKWHKMTQKNGLKRKFNVDVYIDFFSCKNDFLKNWCTHRAKFSCELEKLCQNPYRTKIKLMYTSTTFWTRGALKVSQKSHIDVSSILTIFSVHINNWKTYVHIANFFFWCTHRTKFSKYFLMKKTKMSWWRVDWKTSFLGYTSDKKCQKPCRELFFSVYTSITFRTKVGLGRRPKNTLIFYRRVHLFL